MLKIARIRGATLNSDPFAWAMIDGLFERRDAAALVVSYPRDHYRTVDGYDGEKGYHYEARSLIGMDASVPSHVADLSPAWRQFAQDLLSPAYRSALAHLTGLNLGGASLEVNVFHYGPGAWLGPHLDLKDKIVTHVFYFNPSWKQQSGGCLKILRSSNMEDVAGEIPPVVGNSSVLVRSDRSWHAVSHVAPSCPHSRRSVTVTFYHPGSVSTMWPPGDQTPLHSYEGTDNYPSLSRRLASWLGLRRAEPRKRAG